MSRRCSPSCRMRRVLRARTPSWAGPIRSVAGAPEWRPSSPWRCGRGEFTEEFAAQPLPDPAAFGLPTEDDGTREDPLLSGASSPVTDYVPDLEALRAQREKLVLAIGAATGEALTARTTRALADALDLAPTEFPGGHGGFTTGDPTHPEDPVAFARRLEQVLDAA